MDNVTHSLFALTIARTRLCRAGRGTTVALVLSSNAPDIDVLATARGALDYLEWHRGPTHGPLGVVGLGLVTAGLVWMGLRATRGGGGDRDASFGRLAGVSILGVFLHVMMDVPTSYGTRLLSPFDWHWFAADWMPILDVYLLGALAAGLYFGGRSDAARRRSVAIVLTLMAGNYGIRGVAHHQAIVLAPRLFRPTLERCAGSTSTGALLDRWPGASSPTLPEPGYARCLVEVAAVPSFSSPFEWRVIARMSNAYETQDVNVLSPRILATASEREVLWRLPSRFPDQWTPAAVSAATTRTGQVFLGFSRFPVTRSFRDEGGVTTVRWSDLRFVGTGPLRPSMATGSSSGDRPGQTISRSLFSATVRLDAQGRVLDERLGP